MHRRGAPPHIQSRHIKMDMCRATYPFSGAVFCFRGRRGDLVKILYWDGQGFCLFAKRLENGRFTWPTTKEGSVTLTPAQMSMLLEGLEWRTPRPTWAPTLAG